MQNETIENEKTNSHSVLDTESPKNVPKLRFKEFDGEWVEKKLGDVANFHNSKRIPLTESDRHKGIYPYYGASGIIDYVKDYIFNGEYILLGEDGANIVLRNSRLVFLAKGKFWVNNHAHVFQSKESNYFLCETLERISYSKYNTGTAQPKLNSDIVKKIKLNLPTLPEQQKIADCLSTWDEVIETQKSLIEAKKFYKKGMMQKIFSQEIRFKDDDGADYPAWVEKKLGECIKHIGGTSLEKYVSDDSTYKFISIGNYSKSGRYIDNGQRVLLNDKTKTKLLNKNDLVMVLNDKTSSGDIIGSTILVKKDDEYIYNQRSERIICGSLIFPLFLWHLLNFEKFRQRVFSLSQGGTQIYINFSAVKSIDFLVPTIGEQTKIANFLSAIDEDIELLESQLTELDLQKKGLMQGMFV
ncbi:restriction endonuclease subunit S [Francisellaceae bacterium CB299]|jgi:type I restriction enzyme S subunit